MEANMSTMTFETEGQAEIKLGDPVSLQTLEEIHLRRILAQAPSIGEAAAILGIDTATLWRKRKRLGIE
jgi:NtrC-family two-component system response regulator AlgB